MKTTVISVVLSTCLFLTGVTSVRALPLLSRELIKSIVVLTSPSERGCATGFFFGEGLIFTSGHVVEQLCPYLKCNDVKVLASEGLGSQGGTVLPIVQVSIAQYFPAIDLAVLQVTPRDPSVLPRPVLQATQFKPRPGEHAYVLGYPHCRSLELVEGQIEQFDPLYFDSSLQISHGSSGSPIFNEQLELIGVVSQTESFVDAVASLLLGTRFGARALRADLIQTIFELPPPQALALELQTLERLYEEKLTSLDGVARLMHGITFIHLIEGLRSELVDRETLREYALPLTRLGAYPAYRLSKADSEIAHELQKLVFLYNLENLGPHRSGVRRINLSNFPSDTHESVWQREQVERMIKQGYSGAQVYLIKLTLLAVLVGCGMLIMWAYTCGMVFSWTRGALVRRISVMLAVAFLFWPLSFLMYWHSKRRRVSSRA